MANAASPRRRHLRSSSKKHTLSAGEALRFKAILDDTISSLQVAQTLHKPNMTPSRISKEVSHLQHQHSGQHQVHIDRRAEKQTYLRDARMIDKYFGEIITLFNATGAELEEKQSWHALQAFVQEKVGVKQETEQLLQEICDVIEQKKKIEGEILTERKEFKTQEASMLRDIEVLEKRCNSLLHETSENLQYEADIASAERASLGTMYRRQLGGLEGAQDVVTRQIKDEQVIHKFCTDYLDEHNKYIIKSIQDRTKMEMDDIESADKMISELQLSLDGITGEYNTINDKVEQYAHDQQAKERRRRLMKEKQKQLELEKTKQITGHVFNKIIDKFNKKKVMAGGKKKKKGKAKKKKKR